MMKTLIELELEWLNANDNAVNEASKCLTKKGYFNPPLEKPWAEWERLRTIANDKWYEYYDAIHCPF